MTSVLISGGSGFIGRQLVCQLVRRGYRDISVLSRDVAQAETVIRETIRSSNADLASESSVRFVDSKAIQDDDTKFDVIFNFNGHNLNANRWTERIRRQIYDSRVQPTKTLVEFCRRRPPKLFFSGSAIGVYGNNRLKEFSEDVAPE